VGLLFTKDAHAALADGTLTETWRTWKRAQVKVGGRYRVMGTDIVLLVDALERSDDRWHVTFHRVDPAPPPPALSLEEILVKLDRMDGRAAAPWTRATLRLIGEQPGVVSTELAAQLGRERFELKADVRKLKALGLTESLEVGYRLTPLGAEVASAP
jgi:hypothetical protein